MPTVIKKQVVAAALARLRQQKIHTLFAGYLHLHQLALREGRDSNLKPDFVGFFEEFFEVPDHPVGAPYIKPFTEQPASTKNLWLNENVAGAYAPSSLRPNQPFRQVVDVNDRTREYSLRENHRNLAVDHLLYGAPVNALDLAIFLYRDYGITRADARAIDLVTVFAYEFGFSNDSNSSLGRSISPLFTSEYPIGWDDDWLEVT